MESTANAWSPNQLKLFTSMFSLHNHDLPFALTGKELWTNCTKGLLEESDIYTGFIPYDGLDQIPFEIRFGNDGRDFSDNMGFVKLDSFPTQTDSWLGTVSDRAYIYAIVGESNNGICRILDKALTESGLFNSRINLKISLGLDKVCFDETKASDLLGKEIPIDRITISNASTFGEVWDDVRTSRHSERKRPIPFMTWLSFVGSGVAKLVSLILTGYIFTLMTNRIEIVLFAVLIFIFSQIRWSMQGQLAFYMKSLDQYIHILKLLRDPWLRQDGVSELMEEEKLSLRKMKIRTYIDMVYLSLLYVIATLMIISVVIGS